MVASPARTPIRVIKTRTPARTDLFTLTERVAKARADATEVHKPFQRALDQLENARAGVHSAEAALVTVDAQEAALIGTWDAGGSVWPPPSPSAELKKARADADDALAVARRTLSTVERNVEVARAPADRAAQRAAEISKDTGIKVIDVVMEEAQAALERLANALTQVAEAAGAVRSISEALVVSGNLSAAEHVRTARSQLRTPELFIKAAPYLDLIRRLADDADAVLVT